MSVSSAFATATADRPALDVRPGLIAAAIVCFVYGGLALSVDFPRAAFGFQSDEATYYMMAHSLAADGDLEYRRADLVRVWREFPSGPSGVFLKLGRTVRARVNAAFPFLHVLVRPGPGQAAAVLREVVHVSARRRAVRVAVRHERISPAPRVAARTCRRGGLCLPGGPESVASRVGPGERILSRFGRTRLSGVDDARAVQPGDGDAGVLLLVVQASDPGARRFAASDGFRQRPQM